VTQLGPRRWHGRPWTRGRHTGRGSKGPSEKEQMGRTSGASDCAWSSLLGGNGRLQAWRMAQSPSDVVRRYCRNHATVSGARGGSGQLRCEKQNT
jgi:hypothetical protein